MPSRAVFLRTPDWTWETIARRYNVPITPEDRLRPGGFWQWVQNNSEVPIILEEGSKKAGCLLSLGYAAIGLPGIWMGRKYTNSITKFGEHLIPDLALFAQEGRPITILFDSDRKYATKINVYKAIIATAKLLSKVGCKVTVAILPDVEGDKNAVDDFVVAGGDIDPIIENAIDWEDYRENCNPWKQKSKPQTRAERRKKLRAEHLAQWLIQRQTQLKTWWRKQRKYTPTIIQNNIYAALPETIPDGSIVALKSGLGTGKTHQLLRLFSAGVADIKTGICIEPGQFYFDGAIILGARNGLLLQIAERLGFKHLQNDQCFSELHEEKSQIALCTDSLPHYLDPKWFDGKILILDEVMETIKHILTSSTHRKNRAECLKLWKECLRRCKTIIILDGNLADSAIEYMLNLTGYREVIKIENQYKGDRALVEFLIGTPNKKSRMPENMEKPLREKGLNSRDISPYIPMILASPCPAIVTDSQKQAESLERILNMFGKEGLRVDSKTVAERDGKAKKFLENPNYWIKTNLPEFIILSPTAQSGIDINIREYFSDVYALFFGVLGTDSQMQMPGRIRDPFVKWHIACPEYTKNKGENFSSPVPEEIKKAWEMYYTQDMATICKDLPEFFELLKGVILEGLDNPDHDMLAILKAKENYEKANLRECLIEALEEAGHEIKFVELQHDDDGAELLKEANESVVRDEAKDIFKALDIKPEEVQALLAKFDATWEERCEIIKAGYRDRLPGIENSTIWSEELIYLFRKQRDFISQSELYYFLYHPEHLQEQQQELWGYLALGGMKFLGDVRSRHLKIKALEKLNIKYFLESDRLWTCHDPEIKQLLTKARRSKSISAALGITPGKDAIKYLKQVVGLIGYEVRLEKREAAGNRYYKFAPAKGSKKVALDFELVRSVLSECLAQKYDPTTDSNESSNSKWEEAKTAFNLTSPESKAQAESEQMSDGLFNLKDIGENDIKTKLDLYQPPPETPLGDLTLYEDYLPDFADDLEILIGLPPIQQPDLTPMEAFKNKVQTFGWNIIKEAAKLSEALASKVLGFVEKLVDGGEWHFAPG
ncbi:plasmid replication protein, CyRepA1 family [Okeania sp. SIO1I7]|uniref:plasmid replication protein, CyRepA1 family n=1 Tax=Okeania sp. SIO1I7 TaxID=2607772 RepID=UPI0025F340BF|nr:plasmid replication protein, CyRepA1 family [Okeania sp. SIO1I7]